MRIFSRPLRNMRMVRFVDVIIGINPRYVDVVQVADDDLGPAVPQKGRAVIEAMHQRADAVTALKEQLRGVAAGSAGCSGDE
jgi:hypothetical protein